MLRKDKYIVHIVYTYIVAHTHTCTKLKKLGLYQLGPSVLFNAHVGRAVKTSKKKRFLPWEIKFVSAVLCIT